MPIRRPSRVLLRNLPLPFVSNRAGGGSAQKPVDSTLPLIPIIDLMICMVVFLLMSFGASGELVAQKASIKMPKASAGDELTQAPTVAIDPQLITLDERRVADTATLAADPRLERIEDLVQQLETMKRNWSALHPQDEFPGAVNLQADVSIDYRVIKKVMFSAQQAGYPNIRFAVNRAKTN
ncbi:MAG TPA: biopolymer transporter ExbD [Polyangiales bacterium]|nr:biopolymer transporter ExbD [Polyangiales bacterium]